MPLNTAHFISLFITCFLVNACLSQKGKDCEKDADCYLHQTCHFGYCRCDVGFVKNIHHCFKLRKYGEDCQFDEQCNDFRLACLPGPNENIKLCLCGSFYAWNQELDQCVPASDFNELMQNLQENTTWEDNVHLTGQKVFYKIAIAGLFVVAMGLICITFGIIYGCCCRMRGENKKKTEPPQEDVREVADPGTAGAYLPLPTELTGLSSVVPIA